MLRHMARASINAFNLHLDPPPSLGPTESVANLTTIAIITKNIKKFFGNKFIFAFFANVKKNGLSLRLLIIKNKHNHGKIRLSSISHSS